MNESRMDIPSINEDHISQIPALQVLINLGYTYVSPRWAEQLEVFVTDGRKIHFSNRSGGR